MTDPARPRRRPRWAAVLTGVAAAAAGLGAGELVAAAVVAQASPTAVVGGALVDAAPRWAKETAIAWFGTGDKLALLVGIGIVVAVLAGVAGVLEARRPPLGRVLVAVAAAAGVIAAVTRSSSTWVWAVPSLVAGLVAVLVLRSLARRLAHATDAVAGPVGGGTDEVGAASDPSRRGVLVAAGATTAIGVLAALAGSAWGAAGRAVETLRAALRLPTPAVAAAPVPAGAELDIDGLARVVTANADFYRIDTALVVPTPDPTAWRLRVTGMVAQEVEISLADLLAEPLEEHWITLACVSNEVGGDLISNAKWLGLPIRTLLERAGVDADADMVLSRSVDGFTASTPLEALTDPDRPALLAVGMNDEPLPAEHGFPVRMVVPGLYGYVSATKWVVALEVGRFDSGEVAYWTQRGWTDRGPIKLQSRIDVPSTGTIAAGDTVIAGVAWHQHTGIRGVEVRVDDGAWQTAQLATAIGIDTWVQWRMPWAAGVGTHVIAVRAIGADGEVQTDARVAPYPDGATGWHEIRVEAS